MQVQVARSARQALHRDAAHGDLLHQLLVVGVQRVQAVNLVVRCLVRGRVAQQHQGLELLQGFQGLCAFHLLRFVQDQDGSVRADDINRAARLEVVQHLVNAAVVSPTGGKGLHVDDHDVDARIRRKALQVVQLLGVVDEEARLLLVGLQEVLGGDLERLGDALTDGDAGHDDDELAPAIAAVQLEDRLDVAVGLARARFHLHIEVDAGDLVLHQRVGQRQVLAALHLLDVVQQSKVGQRQVRVLEARVREQVFRALLGLARVNAIGDGLRGCGWLALEAIHHGLHRRRLVGLCLELEFHRGPFRCTSLQWQARVA